MTDKKRQDRNAKAEEKVNLSKREQALCDGRVDDWWKVEFGIYKKAFEATCTHKHKMKYTRNGKSTGQIQT